MYLILKRKIVCMSDNVKDSVSFLLPLWARICGRRRDITCLVFQLFLKRLNIFFFLKSLRHHESTECLRFCSPIRITRGVFRSPHFLLSHLQINSLKMNNLQKSLKMKKLDFLKLYFYNMIRELTLNEDRDKKKNKSEKLTDLRTLSVFTPSSWAP